jgi:hypothetical protein
VLGLAGSARSDGLGGAGAALLGDAGSVFSNPAGLAIIRNIAFETTYRRAAGEGAVLTGAAGVRMRQLDVGLGVKYLGFDSTSILPSPGDQPHELEAVGSLIYRFGLIAFGGSVRYVRSSEPAGLQEALSGDLGLALAFFDIMAIGFAVQNLDENWRSNSALELPRLSRLGFTMNYADPQETFRLMSVLEVQWRQGMPSRIVAGGEAGVVVRGLGILGRAAYRSRSSAVGDSAISLGGSLALGRIALDYAYAERDNLGPKAHRAGLRLAL